MRVASLGLALVLAAAPALADDYARLERPEVANRCVAWLLSENVRPLPRIVYTDEMPWLPEYGYVPGFYVDGTITLRRKFNQVPSLLHEMAHHYGVTEREARSVARRGRNCENFM